MCKILDFEFMRSEYNIWGNGYKDLDKALDEKYARLDLVDKLYENQFSSQNPLSEGALSGSKKINLIQPI